ncbi:unnamed protein product [Rotaria sp. Silwood2]|nr:unnamed protein product [Rotaria sp. Silwood2]
MTASSATTIQANNAETLFYEEVDKHINSLSVKFRQKCVPKQNVYDDIIKCLTLPKGKPSGLYSSKFIYWVKQNFILMKLSGIDIGCCIKLKKPICIYEAYYNVISEGHAAVSHGGRHKTAFELNAHYSWIPRFCIEIFLKQCIPCQTRKPIKQHVISKPIISLGVMTRLQIDLIDMRTRPDTIAPDIIYNWILNCIDHYSKFSWAFPLKNKSANDVAVKLRELFFCLRATTIASQSRPRHPQSQGCIERANGVLCDALGKWMATNNSSHWSEGLLPVVYGINTRVSSITKTAPYQVMFGQPPRSDSEFWKLVEQNGIADEEDLPTLVAESDGETMYNKQFDSINSTDVLGSDVVHIVQKLSDDVVSNSLIDISSPQPSSARHDLIRKIATDNYLTTANKRMKQYQDSVTTLTEKFNVNDCVGVPIHPVDRTNTDAKYLPCLIVEKIKKDKNIMYKLVCQYGKLENTFAIEHLVDLKSACPQELKQLTIDDLQDITMIEACKLYVRGSISGSTCDCKGKCATKQCPCKKAGVSCSTKCHSKLGACKNMGE